MLAIEKCLTCVDTVNYVARKELELQAGDSGPGGFFEVNEDGHGPAPVNSSPSKSVQPAPAPPADLPVTHCKTIAFRQVFTPSAG